MENRYKRRLIILLTLTLLAGLALKYYQGPGRNFFNNLLAGSAYVVFWCLLFKLLLPHCSSLKIIIHVTLFTCVLEFLQLWQPHFLIYLRSFWLGKTILGTTFNWTDFPFYFLGAFLAWLSITRDNN